MKETGFKLALGYYSSFELIIVPLDENYYLSPFSCANSELND